MAARVFTVILNRGSTPQEREKLAQAITGAFLRAGAEAEIVTVSQAGELPRIGEERVKRAKAQGNLLVAAGGDGTINAIAGICRKHGLTLGVIPLGTFNYFARELAIPLEIDAAVEIILAQNTRTVAVGMVQERVFLNNASFGLYTRLIRQREEASSRFGRMRIIAACAAVYSMLHHQKLFTIQAYADGVGQLHTTSMVFVGNNTLQLENLGLEVAGCTKRNKLAIVIMKPANRLQIAFFILRGMAKNLKEESRLESFCADNFIVTTRRKTIDLVIDGEIIRSATPLHFQVEKDALRVIAPAQVSA